MKDRLAEINRNSFLLILGLSIVVILAGVVAYVVLPQFKQYSAAKHSYSTLKLAVKNDGQLHDELLLVEKQITLIHKKLNGEGVNLPFKQFEAHVIGQLQQTAWRNNIELAGVRPRVGEVISHFREILFDVNLSGDYFDIYNLLSDFEKTLGFIVINDFHIRPDTNNKNSGELRVKLTLASYRRESL